MRYLFLLLLSVALFSCKERTTLPAEERTKPDRWSQEKAWNWYQNQGWRVGTNFNPSTAINQLEFWQEETFDPETIDRELSWSADLGMNLHRVYLHNLLWDQDSIGFLNRLDEFLTIAAKYQIKTLFVLLDDVWHPVPELGKQPEPIPHVHNSGWVQAPGAAILGDTTRHNELENYIRGVIREFAMDDRVWAWDVYNEPDNQAGQTGRKELEVKNKAMFSLALLKKVFEWARSEHPSQPLTCGLWKGDINYWGDPDSLPPLDRFMVTHSDIISFHAYDSNTEDIKRKIEELKNYNRPIICTEYMARTNNNTFFNVLPILKEHNIAAINWGFVSGRSNTIYPWESWNKPYTAEPEIWFHDILRADGSPYDQEEVDLIKRLTGKE